MVKILDTIAAHLGPRRTALVFGPAANTLPIAARTLIGNRAFRESYLKANEFIEARLGWSIWHELRNDLPPEGVSPMQRNFVEEAVLQMCIFRALMDAGVEYNAVAGISLGEAAAGYASGVLTFEEMLHGVCEVSQAVVRAVGGDLVAVQASPSRVMEIFSDEAVTMSFDLPGMSVWAVPDEHAPVMQKQLRAARVAYVRVGFNCLPHTQRIDVPGLTKALEPVVEKRPTGFYYSPLEGGPVDHDSVMPRMRWVRTIAEPVRFTEMWKRMHDDGFTDIIFIGSSAARDLFGSLPFKERPVTVVRGETLIVGKTRKESAHIATSPHEARAGIAAVFRTAAFSRNPYEYYREARGERAVHKHANDGFYSVFGYDAAASVLKQPAIFSSSPFATLSPNLLGADAPVHSRVRRALMPCITRERIAAHRDEIEATTDDVLSKLRRRKSFDVVMDLASYLPFAFSCRMIGLHEKPAASLVPLRPEEVTWEDADMTLTSDGMLRTILDRGELSREDVMQLLPFLIGAGSLTVRDSLCFGVHTLVQNPDLHEAVIADSSMLAGFVEELFRFEPAVHGILRRAVTDTTLDGVEIPEGSKVWVWIGAANRDPAKFDRPDEFLFDRTGDRHMAFGAGPHFCMGSHLGRMEIEIVLKALLSDIPRMRTTDPARFYFATDLSGGDPTIPMMRGMRSWQVAYSRR